jgi:hypothetical protein
MAGAPVGNQNAAQGKLWNAAIRRALGKPSRVEGKVALDELAEKLVELAMAGEIAALKEVGDRVDGKPAQSVEVGGADGGPVQHSMRVLFASE